MSPPPLASSTPTRARPGSALSAWPTRCVTALLGKPSSTSASRTRPRCEDGSVQSGVKREV
eukprot:2611541-Pleurochrysis_carterae.AAC.1